MKYIAAGLAALALATSAPVGAKSAPDNWDGLVKVKGKKMDLIYLQPGADFRGYTKVMMDPTQVAFRKDWQRDHNDMVNRVTDKDARRILDYAETSFQKLFAEAYANAGFQVVTEPGPDVLRLSTAVINLDITAPDTMPAGRSKTFARDAGEATLVLEVRDSLSGALLGRAIDREVADDVRPYIRNSVTNASEFEQIFRRWARTSADGLTELKSLSPVDPSGLAKR
jgi:hypothetical protein